MKTKYRGEFPYFNIVLRWAGAWAAQHIVSRWVAKLKNALEKKNMGRSWAIKLGSGGCFVPFCEKRSIVGIGWSMVNEKIVNAASRNQLHLHVSEVCDWCKTERSRSSATGQLFRFVQECQIGDYILYYVPAKKHVVFCKVISDSLYRDFELENEADIFHYRHVEYTRAPVSILDLYGPLKGPLIGPRMSFWEIKDYDAVNQIANGKSPSMAAVADTELELAYRTLSELVLKRVEELNETDWEWLVVDYFKFQGAQVDERKVGSSLAIIDAEAVFDHGELGQEIWRIQVKRYQNQEVDWPEIQKDLQHIEGEVKFCYVSVYGFTEKARINADAEGVLLLEASDFTRFILSEKIRDKVRRKMKIPNFGTR